MDGKPGASVHTAVPLVQILTVGGLLGDAAGSIQRQDGVLGERLLGCVVSFTTATAAAAATTTATGVTEQVEPRLAGP